VDRETARQWWKLSTGKDAPAGGSGAVTKAEIRRWLENSGHSVSGNAWTTSANASPVTRGELCRALYAASEQGNQ